MTGATKPELPATGFASHLEELHQFFRSRGVAFGKPDDLTPFVERLSRDESFRAEMASMVRAIIYRERDGLTPIELLELMVTAVTGTPAADVPEGHRDAVRQMMGFLSGVFRSRWNPGASVVAEDKSLVAAEDKAEVETKGVTDAALAEAAEEGAESTPAEASTRPMTPIFYQAQVVASGGEEPAVVNEPIAAKKPKTAQEQEVVLPLRGKTEAADGPTLNLAGYAAQKPVVAFLRGDGASATEALEAERGRSRGWMWLAIVLAMVVSFGSGMFARQWMFARYGAAWPWHVPAVWTAIHRSTSPPSAAVNRGGAQPSGGAMGVRTEQKPAGRRPAQVEALSRTWRGGSESASDLAPPARPAASPPPPIASGAKPSPEVHPKLDRSARVTAMVGASPALMASHLLFAPEPEYPNLAKIAHIQGPVVVETLVGRDGSVVRAEAISGHRLLRSAAEEAVYGRRYRPYVVNDIPMAVRTLVTVDFRLP